MHLPDRDRAAVGSRVIAYLDGARRLLVVFGACGMKRLIEVTTATREVCFRDAEARIVNRTAEKGDLEIYSDGEKVAHFSAGRWESWRVVKSGG